MLDVVREYAAARLMETTEGEEIARRHALYYLAMAEEAEHHLVRAGHEDWFLRLNVERAHRKSPNPAFGSGTNRRRRDGALPGSVRQTPLEMQP
jgi:hypothetical protein